MSFSAKTLENAEKWEANWNNPQLVCSIKGATVKGGLGPFGLLVLASKDMQEYTAIFFRIFKGDNNNFIVLMCSDQTRYIFDLYFTIYRQCKKFFDNYNTFFFLIKDPFL